MFHKEQFASTSGQKSKNFSRGFFLIEVVVASAVIATVLILLVSSVQDSVEVSNRALERTQAAYLLEEAVEATKSIRNQDWDLISAVSSSTDYYLHWGGSSWSLTTTPENIDNLFTRTIVFSDVFRDINDDITESGNADTGTKKATVTVQWFTPSGIKTESLSFYITET